VGAFALNHVGLFVAFHTMGALIGNLGGEILMFILGNVIIILLEGLIVMIQGLRLMYYELFSKYYSGDGEAFEPVRFQDL
jgi:V/A-type H+-transporting ATPase subunit I